MSDDVTDSSNVVLTTSASAEKKASSKKTAPRRYVVADRTQVNHEGVTYGAGEMVELDDTAAAPLLASGTILASTKGNS